MSATELIKQVAALSDQEKAVFEQLFQKMKNGGHTSGTVSESNWPDFNERLQCIYGDKIAPDSQAIISEGRGER